MTVIRAPSFSPRALVAALKHLVHYRDLVYTLSLHRFKVRYRQSVLGIAWAVVQPLSLMLIYTVIFSRIARVPSEDTPYALFAYCALLPWTYFATALSTATNSLVSHFNLVTKVYFPREILPLTYVFAALIDFMVASTVLAGLMMYYHVPLTPLALYAIPIVALLTLFAVAVSLVLCAVQVRYRDVGVAMPLILQLWIFATPVVYPLSVVPASWHGAVRVESDGWHHRVISAGHRARPAARVSRARGLGDRLGRAASDRVRLLQTRRGDSRRRDLGRSRKNVFALTMDRVAKRYKVRRTADANGGRRSLRQKLTGFVRRQDEFWAVRDVSFAVAEGETLGIIGHNGAGKSTILKLLSSVTVPTSGEIRIYGRLSALIEVGSGFHPELTGRENIYLSGSILGMRRREIADKLERIIEFAGVRDFIDAPVKHYSSGMYVRLGFSIAAHLEPDILLLDEVLAVGDAAFQSKCLDRINELHRQGRTIVFISHDLGAVERLCDRVILLKQGQVMATGTAAEVIAAYQDVGSGYTPSEPHAVADAILSGEVQITSVTCHDVSGEPAAVFRTGSSATAAPHLRRPQTGTGCRFRDLPVFGGRPLFWAVVPDHNSFAQRSGDTARTGIGHRGVRGG